MGFWRKNSWPKRTPYDKLCLGRPLSLSSGLYTVLRRRKPESRLQRLVGFFCRLLAPQGRSSRLRLP